MKFKAFTLAEVLIVIGVIGVVAALTIPTLIKNHQKKVWVEQLKTSVVKIQDGFRLAMAEDGVDDLGETELWSLIPTDTGGVDGINSSNLKAFGQPFITRLDQYIKITTVQDHHEFEYFVKPLNSGDAERYEGAIFLLNGTLITDFWFYDTVHNISDENARINGGAMWKNYGKLVIDVNGPKGPNQLGRDIFYFELAQNGLLYPFGGKDFTILEGEATLEDYKANELYWNQNNTNSGELSCNTKVESNGYGCAARIIEEGWKMNY